jgi:predicted nucleic acid-binding Zn ribbon protein
MFKRRPASLADVVRLYLRESGMETPLLQKRLIEAWDKVTGPIVAQYTGEKKIRNQTLFVQINNPALKADLMMMQSQLVKRLNNEVGAFIIAEIRFF